MKGPTDAALPAQQELYRFLKRSLFRLESATIAVLLLITLAQPTVSLVGLPTWALVLFFAVYTLLAQLLQHQLRSLRYFAWRYLADLPGISLIYFLGGELGGPLFVLFVLAIDCAAATMTLRGTLLYTAASATIVAVIDLVLLSGSPSFGEVQNLLTRLLVLALIGVGMALLRRRLRLEQEAARSVRDEAERLEELEQIRSDFISNVSHDLRTPLTAARAGLGLVGTSATDRLRSDERELMDNVRRNIERLRMQIDNLLTYNQLEADTLRLERKSLDLRAVVVEAVPAVQSLIREKGQILEVNLPETLPTEGEPLRLEQVVVNLLENAHLYTPTGTRIQVHGRLTGDEVLLSVSDDGPGLPAEEREAIFGRFHRFSSTEGGSGLGLTIAREIIELHGGRIWVESRPGQGTTFRFAVPRREGGDES